MGFKSILSTLGAGIVNSITGTAHQIIASGSTGNITLSAPQDIDTISSPTFASITVSNAPVVGTDAANKSYVDTFVSGLTPLTACRVATTATLTATYSNGTSGVGATLTNSGVQAAISIDSVSLSVNDRVLVKNQSTGAQNGIYTVTTVGSGAVNWVLTRATDFDTSAEMLEGGYTNITAGTTNQGSVWLFTTSQPIVVGTTALAFSQFGVFGTMASQNANNVSVSGGAIDGTTIGGTTAAAATITTLKSTGAAYQQKPVVANTGSAYTIDQANGAQFDLTLNAATPVLTLQSVTASQAQILYVTLIQDGTGGKVPSWANVTWATGTAPTVSSVIASRTYLYFISDGTTWTGYAVPQTTGTGSVVQATSPTMTTPNIVGVTDGSSASAGSVGEFISASRASGSALSLTNAQALDFTSITLTAGDWEISGNATVTAGGSTVVTTGSVFIGTAAGNNTTGRDTALNNTFTSVGANSSSDETLWVGPWRVNITGSTTYYMKASFQFSVNTLSVYGHIQARRMR